MMLSGERDAYVRPGVGDRGSSAMVELHAERVLDDGSLCSVGSYKASAFYRSEGSADGSQASETFSPMLELKFASQSLSSPSRRDTASALPWALQVRETGWQEQFEGTVIAGGARQAFGDEVAPSGSVGSGGRSVSSPADSLGASILKKLKKKVPKKKKTVTLVEPHEEKPPLRATMAFQNQLADGLERYQRRLGPARADDGSDSLSAAWENGSDSDGEAEVSRAPHHQQIADHAAGHDADDADARGSPKKKRRQALTAKLLLQKLKKEKGGVLDISALISMPVAEAAKTNSHYLRIWLDSHMRLTRRLHGMSETSAKPETTALVRSFAGLLELVIDLKLRGDSANAQSKTATRQLRELNEVHLAARTRPSKRFAPGQMLYAICFFKWSDRVRDEKARRADLTRERDLKRAIHKFPKLAHHDQKRMQSVFSHLTSAGDGAGDDAVVPDAAKYESALRSIARETAYIDNIETEKLRKRALWNRLATPRADHVHAKYAEARRPATAPEPGKRAPAAPGTARPRTSSASPTTPPIALIAAGTATMELTGVQPSSLKKGRSATPARAPPHCPALYVTMPDGLKEYILEPKCDIRLTNPGDTVWFISGETTTKKSAPATSSPVRCRGPGTSSPSL